MSDPAALQELIAHAFRDGRLLELALTHKSYANENRLPEHNERLEFLGDSVLNLAVSERLMRTCPDATEGELSRLRAAVVSEPTLAMVGRAIGLGSHLLLGRGEDQTGGRDKSSLLADSVEALIAAIYLDAGKDAADGFIHRFFDDAIRTACSARGRTDNKTELQELCQERLRVLPEYRVVSATGPDHRKQFEVEVWINGRLSGRGTGGSKKEAEQKAASEALVKLTEQQ